MTKKDQISFWKKIEDSATILEAVSRQNLQLATQSKVEAKRALEELGAKPERTPRGYQLPEEVQLHLIGNLTKGAESA